MANQSLDRMQHWSKRGTPVAQRFWKHVAVAGQDDCWEWTAWKLPAGYGNLGVGGKPRLAHRVSWEVNFGPIPEGLLVCHRCDRPSCVNPAHLFLGTISENVQDSLRKGRFNSDRKKLHQVRGEQSGVARLTDNRVRWIREASSTGMTRSGIARELGVARGTVRAVLSGETWRHVL